MERAPSQYDAQSFQRILSEIEQRLADLERAITDKRYEAENLGDNRTVTAASGLADLRMVLSTLIRDFQKRGRIP